MKFLHVAQGLLNEGVRKMKAVLALQHLDTQLSRLAEMFAKVYECCGSTVIEHVSKSIVDELPHLAIHDEYAKQLVPRPEALELAKKATNRHSQQGNR